VRYLNIWADASGESHLRELQPEFETKHDYARGVPPVGVSETLPAGEAYILRLEQGWVGDLHPSPARQFVVQLQGQLEVTMSDGTSMTAGTGTLWLVEDTEGKGHRTVVIGDEAAIMFVVTVPESG
jgi:hypothetical protein